MGAESLGSTFLQETYQETLDCLLRSLGAALNPVAGLGVRFIDRLVDISGPQQSLPEQELNRPTLSKLNASKLPAVLEITGATACSGKTQLLQYFIAITLLPRHHAGLELGGHEKAVVLVDLTGRSSILRLRDIIKGCIEARLKAANSTAGTDHDTASLILSSLTHLHVLQPQSTPALIKALESLPNYLLAQPSKHFSSERQLGLIAVSDISAILPQDRLDSDLETHGGLETDASAGLATGPAPAPPADPGTVPPTPLAVIKTSNKAPTLLETRHKTLVSLLRSLRRTFSTPIVLTSHSPHPPSLHHSNSQNQASGPPLPSSRPALPPIWNSLRTLHILVSRDRVSKFSAGMSVEEAGPGPGGEKEQRWEAVRRSGFSGWVNCWNEDVAQRVKALLAAERTAGAVGTSEGHGQGQRQAGGVGAGAGFRFWVDGDGVQFSDEDM